MPRFYSIIAHPDPFELNKRINSALKNDWELHGDTHWIPSENGTFYQALTKHMGESNESHS